MMRLLTLPVLLAFVSLTAASVSFADELETAYQKEYAYLVSEKNALQDRLRSLQSSQADTLAEANKEIQALQSRYLSKQNQVDRLNQMIVDASRDVDFSENDQLLLETTLIQARESLARFDIVVSEASAEDEQLENALAQVMGILNGDGDVKRSKGEFYLADGSQAMGDITQVGRIAKFGIANGEVSALAPSGGGKFQAWALEDNAQIQLIAGQRFPDVLDIFLFDNANVAIEKQEEKGLTQELAAGGLIAKIIVGLGLFGLLLIIIRIAFLMTFGSDIQKTTVKVDALIKEQGLEAALKITKKNMSSASRVITATLRNLKKERDHIEDIISEAILYESSKIDRFGTAILVIAAVSPLLGLLGTVTGMIGTFDIITEFGTGDPKLLSSGISEALITTKYGLVVAIPLLLVGNMLSSWATRTKNGLERAALNVINTHKESPAKA